jgi:hypothetical protein
MAMVKNGFNPTFENRGFWEYYRDLERQFEDFLVYVPYLEGNEETYSFRLANLLLSIGAHIDSALKEIAKYSDFQTKYPEMLKTKEGKPRKPTIMDYYPISEEYALPEEIAQFKRLPSNEKILPFEKYSRKSGKKELPCWWNAYTNVKHSFNENFKEAKLKTTRDALAGAFLLNVIHKPAYDKLFDCGLLKPKYPQGETSSLLSEPKHDIFNGRTMHAQRPIGKYIKNPFTIETSLFKYDYEKVTNRPQA